MIPGQTNTIQLEAYETGRFWGECGEFCGLQHAHMDFILVSENDEDFEQWVAQQTQPASEPADSVIEAGRQVFLGSSCVYWHRIQGTNASGVIGSDLTHLASRQYIGACAVENTRANLAG